MLAGTVALASLSGCSSGNATQLAKQACSYVNVALREHAQSSSASPSRASQLEQDAVLWLQRAAPLAGQAAGQDGDWAPLQATLQEAGQVPVRYLVHALNAQCEQFSDG